MDERNWTKHHILTARKLLELSQKELGEALGWSGKQQISDLERGYKDKQPTVQTAMAIECLLRRNNLWARFCKRINQKAI